MVRIPACAHSTYSIWPRKSLPLPVYGGRKAARVSWIGSILVSPSPTWSRSIKLYRRAKAQPQGKLLDLATSRMNNDTPPLRRVVQPRLSRHLNNKYLVAVGTAFAFLRCEVRYIRTWTRPWLIITIYLIICARDSLSCFGIQDFGRYLW